MVDKSTKDGECALGLRGLGLLTQAIDGAWSDHGDYIFSNTAKDIVKLVQNNYCAIAYPGG